MREAREKEWQAVRLGDRLFTNNVFAFQVPKISRILEHRFILKLFAFTDPFLTTIWKDTRWFENKSRKDVVAIYWRK